MNQLEGQTYWLIGASEGLGRALAHQLDAAGASLVLSARNEARVQDLAADLTHARAVPVDVTDAESVRRARAAAGKIDGLIYCAGAYQPMAATDWQPDTALTIADVNFMGAMRVLGETLPGFVDRGGGDITLIGSLAAFRGLPRSIGYSASKAALLSLAETMRRDLKGTGVTVRIVNPGFIKTRLTDRNSFRMPMLMTPQDAAKRVLKAMTSRRFRTDFPAPFSWALRAMRLVPDWLYLRGT